MTNRRKTTTRSLPSKLQRGVRLNDKDIEILADIGRYGLFDSALCHGRHFPDTSREWCRQKLARLVEAGLLHSVKLQVWYAEHERTQGGRIPAIYCLTPAGADVVVQRTGEYPSRVARSEPAPVTIFHRLQIVKVRLAIDSALVALGLPPAIWTTEQDLRSDAGDDEMPNRRRWLYHEVCTEQGVVTCRPDAAMLLRIPKPGDAGFTNLGGFFEIELSHKGAEQYLEKLRGYEALLQSRVFPYWEAFPQIATRVFWVLPAAERIKRLITLFKRSEAASSFRYTTSAQCGAGLLTDKVWINTAGEAMQIYRPATETPETDAS